MSLKFNIVLLIDTREVLHANASGGAELPPIDVAVSDIAAIIDYLYGSENPLPNCE